jgi:hypothetical protein
MKTLDSLEALRRVNPRSNPRFAQSVEAAAAHVWEQLGAGAPEPARRRTRRLPPAGVALATVAAAALVLAVGWPRGGEGVESATAAVKRAFTVTAASAERSGTAGVRITHDGELWAGRTIRWHGDDLSTGDSFPSRERRPGADSLVVDGMLYGIDPADGAWVVMGPVESIDPDSGTTPGETLAAVREDVGGATLRRLADAMTEPARRTRADGSSVYSGLVPAGQIARERGFKEGQAIRVLPFGYVAHDEAADPAVLLQTAVTVGADGVVRELAVSWGTWRYTVTYSRLGAGAPIVAPANARSLRR